MNVLSIHCVLLQFQHVNVPWGNGIHILRNLDFLLRLEKVQLSFCPGFYLNCLRTRSVFGGGDHRRFNKLVAGILYCLYDMVWTSELVRR